MYNLQPSPKFVRVDTINTVHRFVPHLKTEHVWLMWVLLIVLSHGTLLGFGTVGKGWPRHSTSLFTTPHMLHLHKSLLYLLSITLFIMNSVWCTRYSTNLNASGLFLLRKALLSCITCNFPLSWSPTPTNKNSPATYPAFVLLKKGQTGQISYITFKF